MEKILFSFFVSIFACSGIKAQSSAKNLVFNGHKYEYEKEKREGEIILSTTYPYDMTKEYKQFRSDSTRIMQDSLNRPNKVELLRYRKNK